MGSLGISKEMIVRAKFKDYIATLGDKADDFVKGMTDAAGDALQAKIDEADQLYDSIKSSVKQLSGLVTQMSMQDVAGGLVSGLDSVLSGASSALQAAKALLG